MSTQQTSALWRALTNRSSLFLLAGPCVIESESLCLDIASRLLKLSQQQGVPIVFKASYDKANRSSAESFRGPGIEQGLAILDRVKTKYNLPIVTDIHSESDAKQAGSVVDILQIPAFLSRQTDLLHAAAKTKRIINVKKGQFASPQEMTNVVNKLKGFGNRRIILTERGTTFGYNNLVADMRSIPIMKDLRCPVVFDATHSVQLPGGGGNKSSGQREYAPVLARAAVAAGANGLFIETHPTPEKALSDGPNMIPTRDLSRLMKQLTAIHGASK